MPKLVGTKAVINIVKLVLIFSLIVFPVVTSSSCKSAEIVTSSGNRITESRDLGSLNKVELTTLGSLIIEQGDEESITIEIDDNLMPLVTTDISSGKLSIGFKKGYDIPLETRANFYLKVKSLDGIYSSGFGSIKASDFNTESLEIRLSGLGNITIEDIVVKESIKIDLSGNGRHNSRRYYSQGDFH